MMYNPPDVNDPSRYLTMEMSYKPKMNHNNHNPYGVVHLCEDHRYDDGDYEVYLDWSVGLTHSSHKKTCDHLLQQENRYCYWNLEPWLQRQRVCVCVYVFFVWICEGWSIDYWRRYVNVVRRRHESMDRLLFQNAEDMKAHGQAIISKPWTSYQLRESGWATVEVRGMLGLWRGEQGGRGDWSYELTRWRLKKR